MLRSIKLGITNWRQQQRWTKQFWPHKNFHHQISSRFAWRRFYKSFGCNVWLGSENSDAINGYHCCRNTCRCREKHGIYNGYVVDLHKNSFVFLLRCGQFGTWFGGNKAKHLQGSLWPKVYYEKHDFDRHRYKCSSWYSTNSESSGKGNASGNRIKSPRAYFLY